MMFQMIEIITNEILERRGGVWVDGVKGDFIEGVFISRLRQSVFGNTRNNVQQMDIVGAPQLDEIRPWSIRILLRVDPFVSVVTGERKIVGRLCAYKALVIVGGGVDQVAEDLFSTPFAGAVLVAVGRGDCVQTHGRTADCLVEVLKKLLIAAALRNV